MVDACAWMVDAFYLPTDSDQCHLTSGEEVRCKREKNQHKIANRGLDIAEIDYFTAGMG